MLVFITHPKLFDIKKLKDKKVTLIYIFNSKKLFEELKKSYKCVNIGIDGVIKDENFFPKKVVTKTFLELMFKNRKDLFAYFKKKNYNKERVYLKTGFRDSEYRFVRGMAEQIFKKDLAEAFAYLNREIYHQIFGMIRLETSNEEYEFRNNYSELLKNYTHSFFRSYIYSMGFRRRGVELFGDIWSYNYFLNVMLYYGFSKFDIYKNGFHYNYLRVLSRVFIETIHKNDIKSFIKSNIDYYKENGWWD